MLAQMPGAQITPPTPSGSLQNAPSTGAEPVQPAIRNPQSAILQEATTSSWKVGRAVLCPPQDGGKTLVSPSMPDGGGRAALPRTPLLSSTLDSLPMPDGGQSRPAGTLPFPVPPEIRAGTALPASSGPAETEAPLQNAPPASTEPVQSAIRNPQSAIPQNAPPASTEPVQSAIRNPQSAILQNRSPAGAQPVTAQPPNTAPASDKPANPDPTQDPPVAPAQIAGSDALPPISTPAAATAPSAAPPGAEFALAVDFPPTLAPPVPSSGTPVAITSQRMKFASQKNEIAGSAAQKLPPDGSSVAAPARAEEAIPAPKIRIVADFSDPKEFAAQWMTVDTTAKGTAAPTLTTNVTGDSAPPTGRLEQVERMITREVVMVRQSGAESLSVSLKVDARTSLFLQLTNHPGGIEASVRCEQGDARALGAHWGQLQESLARQNVQLLPLEDKTLPVHPPSDAPVETLKNFQDRPPAQHPPPPPPAPERENPSDDAIKAAVGLTKSKSKSRRYHGWEKWA